MTVILCVCVEGGGRGSEMRETFREEDKIKIICQIFPTAFCVCVCVREREREINAQIS